jgi:hypothetical protein
MGMTYDRSGEIPLNPLKLTQAKNTHIHLEAKRIVGFNINTQAIPYVS